MPDPVRTSIGDVARRYRQRKLAEELVDDWFYLLYRMPSFVVVPVLARLGIGPNAVTLTGGIVALALPWVAWHGGWMALGLFALLFSVIDAVDGDLARTYGGGGPRGPWLDAQVDLLYRLSVYASLGICAGAAFALPGALVAVALALLARLARAGSPGEPRTSPHESGQGRSGGFPRTAGGLAYGLLASLDHALPLLVLACGALGRLPELVGWLLLYSLGDYMLALREGWVARRPPAG